MVQGVAQANQLLLVALFSLTQLIITEDLQQTARLG
jgi:hypothetical protein